MGIEFEEYDSGSNRYNDIPKTGSKMGDWLVKNGFATSPIGANMILIIMAVVVFGLSLYFFVFGFSLPFQSAQQGIDREAFPPGLEL